MKKRTETQYTIQTIRDDQTEWNTWGATFKSEDAARVYADKMGVGSRINDDHTFDWRIVCRTVTTTTTDWAEVDG